MSYETEEITKALQAARVNKGLTQRALSQRVGIPQAHISKIEQGAVDLRLSTLIELARVLDLEVALVPRSAIPAVQSIIRSTAPVAPAHSAPAVIKELQRLKDTLGTISDFAKGQKEIAQFQRQLRELQQLPLTDEHLAALKNVNSALHALKNHQNGAEDIHRVLSNLQTLRNSVVHQVSSLRADAPTRPAYTLDDEAGNG